MQNKFRKFEEIVFYDLWIPDFGFRFPIPDYGFRLRIPVSGFRFPGFRVARVEVKSGPEQRGKYPPLSPTLSLIFVHKGVSFTRQL